MALSYKFNLQADLTHKEVYLSHRRTNAAIAKLKYETLEKFQSYIQDNKKLFKAINTETSPIKKEALCLFLNHQNLSFGRIGQFSHRPTRGRRHRQTITLPYF